MISYLYYRKNPKVITALMKGKNLAAGSMAEGFEEYLQAIIDPAVRNVVLDENNEVKPFTKDALYQGILGAISGGLINTATGQANTNPADIKQAITKADELASQKAIKAQAKRGQYKYTYSTTNRGK